MSEQCAFGDRAFCSFENMGLVPIIMLKVEARARGREVSGGLAGASGTRLGGVRWDDDRALKSKAKIILSRDWVSMSVGLVESGWRPARSAVARRGTP